MIQPGEGTQDTRQIALKSELPARAWKTVQKLANGRLVVTRMKDNEETVEIIHEILIRKWEKSRQWVDDYRKFRLWQEQTQSVIGKI